MLVRDLNEGEFDVLFFEDHTSAVMTDLSSISTNQKQALDLLESKCH